MALILAFGVAAAGVGYYVSKLDGGVRKLSNELAKVQQHVPDSGRWNHSSKTVGLAHGGHVQRSYTDIDIHGAKRYLVDYGGGSHTISYAPPNLIGNAAQNY